MSGQTRSRALLVGGTGPTGPHLLAGLEARGHDVTIMHTGRHELEAVAHVPHLHCDVKDRAAVQAALATLPHGTFDVAVVAYGRLRMLADVLEGRVGKFVSIGGMPAYRGYFDGGRFEPPGMPVPTREDAATAGEEDDGKSYRIRRTEELVFEHHPTASHFRYPMIYGPRQPAPREWCVVRRVLDGRPFIVLPDGGLTLAAHGYAENVAAMVVAALDTPAGDGEIFNAGDEECLTLRQVVELVCAELGRDLEVVCMPAELAVPARPLMAADRTTHRVVTVDKARALLGYRDVVPAREAIGRTARWLVDNPPTPGGVEERTLEDPFDYVAEDALVASWRAALAKVEVPFFDRSPGFGLAYAGPGTSYKRPDTRI